MPILLFAYGLALTTDDIYDNSYALIIGIDKYENVQNLNYAVKDAESIQDILVNTFNFPEGNITLLKNEEANKQAILKAFSDITTKAEDNDRVLIYFAGHGDTYDLPDGGEMGYLLPVDGNNDDLFLSSIAMDDLKRISLMSKAKHLLYLVDACYGGLLTIGARGLDSKSTPNYIEKITKNKSRQIITAGGRGEQVIEKSEWGHSAFTLNLNRGLKDGNADMNADGYITANELGLFLSQKVTIDSDNQQTPQYGRMTSQEGEFVFVYSENTVINQNVGDKSMEEKLDLLLSKIEKLESQPKNNKKLTYLEATERLQELEQMYDDSIQFHQLVDENTRLKKAVEKNEALLNNERHDIGINVFGLGLFSGSDKKIINEQVKGGLLVSIFGNAKLNLVDAKLYKEKNIINIIVLFGGCTILVPPEMYVDTQILPIFGSFKNRNDYIIEDSTQTNKKLIVRGITIFGGGSVRNEKWYDNMGNWQ